MAFDQAYGNPPDNLDEAADPIEIMASQIRPAAFNDAHAFAAREWARVLAKDAVKALDAAGFAVVPKNPTVAMLKAPRGDGWPDHGTHCDTCACLTFDAMVEAGRVKA